MRTSNDEPARIHHPALTSTIGSPVFPTNPVLHLTLKHVQRKSAIAKEFVVKSANVETRSQHLLRSIPQLADLELTNLVRERLPWPCNVPVHLRSNIEF